MNPVVEVEPPFVCPRCGGRSFGRDTEAAADGTVAVLRTVECHGHILTEWYHGSKRSPCGWRGVWPPEMPPEQQPVPVPLPPPPTDTELLDWLAENFFLSGDQRLPGTTVWEFYAPAREGQNNLRELLARASTKGKS